MSNQRDCLRSHDLTASSLAKLATVPNSIRKNLSLALITATASLIGSGSGAIAGGAFAESIQSAFGQGASNAGVAAGGSLSSMFWNPATMTQSGRYGAEFSAITILPDVSQSGNTIIAPLGSAFGFTSGVSNSVLPAVVPSGYASWQFSDRLWAGLSINAPFGLIDKFPNPGWAGAFYGQSSKLKTYNVNPSIAFEIADWISVGAGI